MLVEVELDLFVGDVYAQLFKRIPFEIFKTKYVQNPNSVIIVSAKHNNDNCFRKSPVKIEHERKENLVKSVTKFDNKIYGGL